MLIFKRGKRWLAFLFIAAIVITPLYAEGQKEGAAKKPQVITAFLESGGAGTAVTGAVESFNEMYAPDYKVEVVRTTTKDQLQLTMNELVNQVGAYDVILFIMNWAGQAAQFLEDLTPYMKKYGPSWDEFVPGMKQLATYKGKVFGLPFRTGLNVNFVNNELLAQAGVKTPTTWDEFKAALPKLAKDTNGDGNNDIFGTDLMLGQPRSATGEVSSWFYAQGGEFLKDVNTVHPFDSKHGRLLTEIFTFWKELYDNDYVSKGILTNDFWQLLGNFQEGRTAMAFIYSNRSPHVEDKSKSNVAGKASYVPIPRTSDGWYQVGSWTLSIPNYLSQERKDAAYKFVSHAFTPEAHLRMALKYANGPTIKSVLASKEFENHFPATEAVNAGMPYGKFNIFSLLPNRGEVEITIMKEVHAFITGRKTPKDSAQAIFSRLEEIVKE